MRRCLLSYFINEEVDVEMRAIFYNSYYRRLQFTFIAFVLLPIVILSIITYSMYKNILIDKVKLNDEIVLNVLKNDLMKTFDDIAFTTHGIILDDNIKEMLEELKEKDEITTYEDFKNHGSLKEIFSIAEMKTLSQDVNMYLINNADFIIPSYRTKHTIDELTLDWSYLKERVDFNQTGYFQWLGKIPNHYRNHPENIYFSRVIKESNKEELLGVLNIAISEAYFTELFQQVSSGDLILYDADDNVIFENKTLPVNRSYDNDIKGEVTFSQFDWRLVHYTPKSELTNELTNTFFYSLLIISVFIIVFILLSLFAAYRMHRPIKDLQEIAATFGSGNRKVRYKPKRNDEINNLGLSMNRMFTQINELIIGIEEEQEKKKELELNALYSQIRPHFLMNTLNSIRVNLIVDGDSYHSHKIQSLTMLLRKYLKVNEPSSLKNECELLEYYVDIMKMRSETDINLEIMIPEELDSFELPFLMLQPIVENSILHGFKDMINGTITIYAFKQSGDVLIQITDDGTGMTEEDCKRLNHRLLENKIGKKKDHDSVGLINIKQRLHLIYGDQVGFKVDSELGFGTTVEIKIPQKH